MGISGCCWLVKPGFKGEVITLIETSCSFDVEDECLLKAVDLFGNEWDSVFVVPVYATTRDISDKVGFSCNCSDVGDRFGRVIWIENVGISRMNDYPREVCRTLEFISEEEGGWFTVSDRDASLLIRKVNFSYKDGFVYQIFNSP